MSVIFTVKVDKLSDEKQQDGIQADPFSLHPLSRIPADLWLSMHLVPQRLTVWMNLQAQKKKKKSIIFQSSVYRIYLNCQTWCCMHFDVNKNIIYYIERTYKGRYIISW